MTATLSEAALELAKAVGLGGAAAAVIRWGGPVARWILRRLQGADARAERTQRLAQDLVDAALEASAGEIARLREAVDRMTQAAAVTRGEVAALRAEHGQCLADNAVMRREIDELKAGQKRLRQSRRARIETP